MSVRSLSISAVILIRQDNQMAWIWGIILPSINNYCCYVGRSLDSRLLPSCSLTTVLFLVGNIFFAIISIQAVLKKVLTCKDVSPVF